MCGRFACGLDPSVICRACQYRASDGTIKQPKWIDNPRVATYHPSSNIAPTNYSPVLLSNQHLDQGKKDPTEERIIHLMRFGLIPSWHKGEEAKMQLSTINCRRESILDKKTFSGPLKKGRRCVVLAEGYVQSRLSRVNNFYEWKKMEHSKEKQPYLIYPPEDAEFLQAKDKAHFLSQTKIDQPMPLLKMAAIFDVWQPNADEPEVFSYSILTVQAAKSLTWLHERMPALLRTDEAVAKWLDFTGTSVEEALDLIHPVEELVWHPVTRAMGNAGYKDPDASKPISLEEAKASGKALPKGQLTMTAFFQPTGKNKTPPGAQEEDTKDLQRPSKLPKTEASS